MRKDGHGLHAKLELLVEVGAVEHATPDIFVVTLHVGPADPVVTAIPVPGTLLVLFVALVF